MRITIQLDDPGQLFAADPPPPTSPSFTRFTAEPALAVVRREAWDLPRREPLVLDVVLPAARLRPGLADELTEAARRWWAVTEEAEASAGRARTRFGLAVLLPSVVWFAILIVASFFVLRWAQEVDETFVRALGQGLTVAAWVILWAPVERLSRTGLERRARRRRAAWLGRVTVEVRAAD